MFLCPAIYVLGPLHLRLGEARNLELQDADLKAAVLTIRGTKFGKTRLVPLRASTCTVLADYIARRQRHWAGRAVSSYLFVSCGISRELGGNLWPQPWLPPFQVLGFSRSRNRRQSTGGYVHAWSLQYALDLRIYKIIHAEDRHAAKQIEIALPY